MRVGEFRLKSEMAKAAIYNFIIAVAECVMCGTKTKGDDDLELTDQLYNLGWRVENDRLLCQHCTDNKR